LKDKIEGIQYLISMIVNIVPLWVRNLEIQYVIMQYIFVEIFLGKYFNFKIYPHTGNSLDYILKKEKQRQHNTYFNTKLILIWLMLRDPVWFKTG